MTAGTDLVPVEGVDAAVDLVAQQVAEAEARADALQVSNDAEASVAGEILRDIQRRRKAAKAEHKGLVGPLWETKKRIDQKFKNAMAPFDAADAKIREKLGTYQAEQERIRQEEEARLEAERQERERKAREDRERQEAEERAKREQAEKEAREAGEEAKAAQDEADREAAERLAEEARQKAEEAKTAEAAIASLPEPTLPRAVVPAAPRLDGITQPKRWVAEVVDASQVPRAWLVVDEVALRKHMHETLKVTGGPPVVPGVEFRQVTGTAVRA